MNLYTKRTWPRASNFLHVGKVRTPDRDELPPSSTKEKWEEIDTFFEVKAEAFAPPGIIITFVFNYISY